MARWLSSPLALVVEALGLLAVAVLAAVLLLKGRDVPVPRAIADMVERQAEAALATDLEIGRVSLTIEGAGRLRVVAEDVRLIGPDGTARAAVPRVTASLGLTALAPPVSAPRDIRIEGAALRIGRRADGTLDLGSDVLAAIFTGTPPRTPAEAAGRVRGMLDRPVMQTMERLTLDGLSLAFEDARSGRSWAVSDARLVVERGAASIALSLSVDTPGEIALRTTIPSEGPIDLQFAAQLAAVPAADLAAEVPALVWLSPLEAEVSGALIGTSGADGTLGRLDGTLEIGAGRLAPLGGGSVPFDTAQAYFTYRPDTARLTFSQLVLEAPNGRVSAEGHAYLHAEPGQVPASMTAQITLQEARFDAGAALPAPLAFSAGAIAARIGFAPFVVDVGQVVLASGPARARADAAGQVLPAAHADTPPEKVRLQGRGRIEAAEGGFPSTFDLSVSEVSPERLLAFWPVGAAPRTREWLARNLLAGRILGTRAGVRLVPGARPAISFSFRFQDARVRALGGLPPIEQGAGHGSLGEDRFSLTVEAGRIVPPAGGALDVSGSVFTIANTRKRPSDATVHWRSSGTLTAALSLLDQPPLRLLSRAGRSVEMAEAQAVLDGELRFPVKRGVQNSEISYAFDGVLRGLTSSTLVPNRTLDADLLNLVATSDGLDISGRAALDGVPLDLRYLQAFGADSGPPVVSGTAEVTGAAADAFGIALPPGTLSGRGAAEFTLRFPAGEAPVLELASDLRGLGLGMPAIGWAKPEAAAGRFDLTARLGASGAPPRVEALALSAPDLDASGVLTLSPSGGMERLALDTARVGGWLDARVDLVGRGPGQTPDLVLDGGRLDLRGAPFGLGGRNGGAGLGRASGRLDRLTVTEGLALTDLTFDLDGAGGLSGALSGRLNGGAPIQGQLRPGQGGRPTLSVSARDAGGVLASAGAFQEAQGGALSLTLTPQGSAGAWEGALTVEDIRVTAAPGLAALLNAISVVGLIDQLNGPGLAFSAIRAAFRLTPNGVQVTSASAVGPSLGISAEGVYDTARDRVDLRGVLSPIYFVNAIGQVFTRQGEGLFGMNYTVQGSASDPEIRVNPLSMLTPGAFRDIFRTAPPALPDSAR
ncbi:MAG: AsmA-like C-terminal region-containing protein [Pseudomonadota bacterium]